MISRSAGGRWVAVIAVTVLVGLALLWRGKPQRAFVEPSEATASAPARSGHDLSLGPEGGRGNAENPSVGPAMLRGKIRVVGRGDDVGACDGALGLLAERFYRKDSTTTFGVQPSVARLQGGTTWHNSRMYAPVATGGMELPVTDCKWTCAIPTEGLFVGELHLSGLEYRILSGGEIPAGATEHTIVAEPITPGVLRVTDARTGSDLNEVEVREVWTPTLEDPSSIIVGDLRIGFGNNHDPHIKKAQCPPVESKIILQNGKSPCTISRSDRDREIWVGRVGYGWRVIEWPVDRMTASVELEVQSELSVELTNVEGDGQIFDCFLLQGTDIVAAWRSIRQSGRYTVSDLPSGAYSVRILYAPPNGARRVIDQDLHLLPGESRLFQFDLGAARQSVGELGSLSVSLLGEPLIPLAGSGVRLSLSPVEEGEAGVPAYQRRLDLLNRDARGAYAEIGGLPSGRYLLRVLGTELSQAVDIRPGTRAESTLDLGALCQVDVWPVDELGNATTTGVADLRLFWAPATQEPEGESGSNFLVPWPDGFGKALSSSPPLSLIIPEQEAIIWLTDPMGQPVSESLQVQVKPGVQEYSLLLGPFDGGVAAFHLNPGQTEEWRRQELPLRSRFQPLDGRAYCTLVRMVPGSHSQSGEMDLIAYFSEPGAYVLPFSEGGSLTVTAKTGAR